MAGLFHPAKDDIMLAGIMAALGDPVRLKIVQNLKTSACGLNCGSAVATPELARSTLTHHMRILRESGLVFSSKKGPEVINTLRRADLDERFPGLLDSILKYA